MPNKFILSQTHDHIINDISLFAEYKSINQVYNVPGLSTNYKYKAKGDVQVGKLVLKDALYTPEIADNIISIPCLLIDNPTLSLIMQQDEYVIKDTITGAVILKKNLNDDLQCEFDPLVDLPTNKAILNKDATKLDLARKILQIHRGHGHLTPKEVKNTYFRAEKKHVPIERITKYITDNCRCTKDHWDDYVREPKKARSVGDRVLGGIIRLSNNLKVCFIIDSCSQYTLYGYITNENQFTKTVIGLLSEMDSYICENGNTFVYFFTFDGWITPKLEMYCDSENIELWPFTHQNQLGEDFIFFRDRLNEQHTLLGSHSGLLLDSNQYNKIVFDHVVYLHNNYHIMKQTSLTPFDCFHDSREADLDKKIYPLGCLLRFVSDVGVVKYGVFAGYPYAPNNLKRLYFISLEDNKLYTVNIKNTRLNSTRYPKKDKYHIENSVGLVFDEDFKLEEDEVDALEEKFCGYAKYSEATNNTSGYNYTVATPMVMSREGFLTFGQDFNHYYIA